MEWISNKLLRFILKKEVIKNDPDYIAFYKYGIEITVSSVISFLLVILLGIFTNSFVDAIVFLITLLIVRSFTGGYHASTYYKCNICMCISYINILLLKKYIATILSVVDYIIISIVIVFVILLFCPVENEYKPISVEKRKSLKMLSITISIVICAISFLMKSIGLKLGETLLFTMVIVSLLVLVAKFNEGRSKKWEQ